MIWTKIYLFFRTMFIGRQGPWEKSWERICFFDKLGRYEEKWSARLFSNNMKWRMRKWSRIIRSVYQNRIVVHYFDHSQSHHTQSTSILSIYRCDSTKGWKLKERFIKTLIPLLFHFENGRIERQQVIRISLID